MERSPESALLRVTHHSSARSAVIDRRYRNRCWGAAVMVAILAVAGTAKSADAPPLLSPEQMNAGEIQLALQKLNVLGRVLYIAAHPDDENTNLMAFWANGSLYDAAYLSVTRGDGGQNIIGPELGERLGVIRTEELLDARRIDHARQFFTRAIDFGFSKTADETMHIWGHDKILADVVWIIRNFRPDVIVTRFSPEDEKTHGHHTASAILAQEAFSAAADPNRFPEQLAFVKPWQATRLVWNTSPFFFTNRNLPFDPDRSNVPGSRRLQSASRQSVHGNRGGQYQYAQEPGRRWPAATRRAKRIFQTAARSADDELAFRRRRHDLVARCEFRIRCRTNSSDHFEIQSRRSGCVGA